LRFDLERFEGLTVFADVVTRFASKKKPGIWPVHTADTGNSCTKVIFPSVVVKSGCTLDSRFFCAEKTWTAVFSQTFVVVA